MMSWNAPEFIFNKFIECDMNLDLHLYYLLSVYFLFFFTNLFFLS